MHRKSASSLLEWATGILKDVEQTLGWLWEPEYRLDFHQWSTERDVVYNVCGNADHFTINFLSRRAGHSGDRCIDNPIRCYRLRPYIPVMTAKQNGETGISAGLIPRLDIIAINGHRAEKIKTTKDALSEVLSWAPRTRCGQLFVQPASMAATKCEFSRTWFTKNVCSTTRTCVDVTKPTVMINWKQFYWKRLGFALNVALLFTKTLGIFWQRNFGVHWRCVRQWEHVVCRTCQGELGCVIVAYFWRIVPDCAH